MLFHKATFAIVTACAIQSTTADSIYEIGSNNADFSTLIIAVDAAGLADALSGDGTFTLFAPPNSAFEKLPTDLVTKLLEPVWKPQLQDLLKYHVLGSVVKSMDLSDGMTAETLNGEIITINLSPPRVNDVSNILIDDGLVDIEADNGVIHGIDTVLTPTSVISNIVDIAVGNDIFSTLVAAVIAAGLVDALSGEGPLTVFAPTDDAFAALPAGTVEELLLPENLDKLTKILKYHVVAANLHSSTLSDGDVDTLSGDPIKVAATESGVKINGAATVVTPDIIANNGIIHVIDTVLLPPADGVSSAETESPTGAPSTTEEESEDGLTDGTETPTGAPSTTQEESGDGVADGEDGGSIPSGAILYGTIVAVMAVAAGTIAIA